MRCRRDPAHAVAVSARMNYFIDPSQKTAPVREPAGPNPVSKSTMGSTDLFQNRYFDVPTCDWQASGCRKNLSGKESQ
jgi:hypothetical protein